MAIIPNQSPFENEENLYLVDVTPQEVVFFMNCKAIIVNVGNSFCLVSYPSVGCRTTMLTIDFGPTRFHFHNISRYELEILLFSALF